jgi:23S rRNA pseudouridine2605 synthase
MEIRLQKFLANAGVASRRKSEELILQGCIKVDGQVVTELGSKVNESNSIVEYNGEEVKIIKNFTYIMLHKPEGYITTVKEQFERPMVIDLIPGIKERVVPVGRLDYDTSGLLLLTNDGDLTFKLTHPKNKIEKIYIAKVEGKVTEDKIDEFEKGLMIGGYKTAPAKLKIINTEEYNSTLKISIYEGKNRQVRKMCELIGHRVVSLKRVATGELPLGDLKRGEYRTLTKNEVAYLKNL